MVANMHKYALLTQLMTFSRCTSLERKLLLHTAPWDLLQTDCYNGNSLCREAVGPFLHCMHKKSASYLDFVSVIVVIQLNVGGDDFGKDEGLFVLGPLDLVGDLLDKGQSLGLVLHHANHGDDDLDQAQRVEPATHKKV